MIMTVEKLEAEVKALRENWRQEQKEADRKTCEARRKLNEARQTVRDAIRNREEGQAIFRAKQRRDLLRLHYEHAKQAAAIAAQKRTAAEEDGREILRGVKAYRQKIQADSLAESWEAFLQGEKAADKYRELAAKCSRTIIFYNDTIAPIREPIAHRNGRTFWKDPEDLQPWERKTGTGRSLPRR